MTHAVLRRRGRLALVLATTLVSLGVAAANASAATTTFSNGAPIDILDDQPASPFPSNISVSGFAGNVQKVTATLRGYSHTCSDDVAVLLVGPSGTNSILMGRVGGCNVTPVSDVTLTFDQAATATLNEDDNAVTGTFRPSQLTSVPDPLSPPAPGGPYPVDLNEFNGKPANGTWSLFIEDQVAVDVGSVAQGWSLNVTAPVNTTTVGTATLNKKKGTAQVPVTVGDAGQLTMSGSGIATVASAGATKSVAVNPGTTVLTVRATGKKAKKLKKKGKVSVSPTITFTPTGGTAKSTPLTVKLKKKIKK